MGAGGQLRRFRGARARACGAVLTWWDPAGRCAWPSCRARRNRRCRRPTCRAPRGLPAAPSAAGLPVAPLAPGPPFRRSACEIRRVAAKKPRSGFPRARFGRAVAGRFHIRAGTPRACRRGGTPALADGVMTPTSRTHFAVFLPQRPVFRARPAGGPRAGVAEAARRFARCGGCPPLRRRPAAWAGIAGTARAGRRRTGVRGSRAPCGPARPTAPCPAWGGRSPPCPRPPARGA